MLAVNSTILVSFRRFSHPAVDVLPLFPSSVITLMCVTCVPCGLYSQCVTVLLCQIITILCGCLIVLLLDLFELTVFLGFVILPLLINEINLNLLPVPPSVT